MKHVVVAGSTGVVGREVIMQLAGRADVQVAALVRRAGSAPAAIHVREVVFDFERDYEKIGGPDLPCDVLICAIGTTINKAGSQAAFTKVDRDIPVALARRLAVLGHGVFGLVSSVGADKPAGFYLETKAAVEAAVVASGIAYVIVRPSLLLGDRSEFRLGERFATIALAPLMNLGRRVLGKRLGASYRYMPIAAKTVAAALVDRTLSMVESVPVGAAAELVRQSKVLEGLELFAAGGEAV